MMILEKTHDDSPSANNASSVFSKKKLIFFWKVFEKRIYVKKKMVLEQRFFTVQVVCLSNVSYSLFRN
jgi:hypothetical protein